MLPILGLVLAKSVFTPILTHVLVDEFSILFTGSTDPALSNFGFLYGTFPTALGVDSYASQYNVNPDLVSAAIVICTAFSAPVRKHYALFSYHECTSWKFQSIPILFTNKTLHQ